MQSPCKQSWFTYTIIHNLGIYCQTCSRVAYNIQLLVPACLTDIHLFWLLTTHILLFFLRIFTTDIYSLTHYSSHHLNLFYHTLTITTSAVILFNLLTNNQHIAASNSLITPSSSHSHFTLFY